MEINDIYEKVIESAQNIKYMRDDISDMKKEMKEETKACHKRIDRIKGVQDLNAGKMTVILITIGAVILAGVQALLWFLDKMIK